MYTCFNAYIIYGFMESERDLEICDEFLEKFAIEKYASDVVKGYAGEWIYGIPCKLDKNIGAITISDDEKEIVKNAYHTATVSGDYEYKLGFYTVLSGDCESCHTIYNPESIEDEKCPRGEKDCECEASCSDDDSE